MTSKPQRIGVGDLSRSPGFTEPRSGAGARFGSASDRISFGNLRERGPTLPSLQTGKALHADVTQQLSRTPVGRFPDHGRKPERGGPDQCQSEWIRCQTRRMIQRLGGRHACRKVAGSEKLNAEVVAVVPTATLTA